MNEELFPQNRAYTMLPVYTGDVSGACSALFELGGMVVIHDPSGCNSTYNTHDETRWYDTDSLIFISGLTERDAILGNDDKFIVDVVQAALELHPRFIALCNSPIPYITGTDFPALARIIEQRTCIPCFYIPTNGMHDYTIGAGRAFAALAERFAGAMHLNNNVQERAAQSGRVLNILGVTPLDLGRAGSPETLRSFAETAGFSDVICWAMGATLDDLARANQAQVNLVISATGLEAAKVLQRLFGTPHVVGLPVGEFAPELSHALRVAVQRGENIVACADMRTSDSLSRWAVVGEPVSAGSIACAIERELGHPVRVIAPVEQTEGLLVVGDNAPKSEDEIASALADCELVLADAFYRDICPTDARFIELPHQALSGRNSWHTAFDLAAIRSIRELFS